MIEMRKNVEPGETPAVISVSMIDQDLKNGVSKSDMAIKYNIKPWEVDRMFEHPDLKGRRPSKRKPLSFQFVDDLNQVSRKPATEDTSEPQFSERKEDVLDVVDPNQVTLETAIDEAIESVKDVQHQMLETQAAISDMLSPTEFESDDNELELPTVEDTMELVEEQEMEITEGPTFNL